MDGRGGDILDAGGDIVGSDGDGDGDGGVGGGGGGDGVNIISAWFGFIR